MKLKATIAYDGSLFNGFQLQKNKKSVVGDIQKALLSLGVESQIVGSGRTDKGVHASNQVIHFFIPPYWEKKDLKKLKIELNKKLEGIEFKYITKAPLNFHAIYSAKMRIYRYVIKKRVSVFERKYIVKSNIDNIERLNSILKIFEGKHNFLYFHKKGSNPPTTIKNIYRAFAKEYNGKIFIYFYGDGFLRSQIRMMMEGVFQVYNNNITLSNLKEQLLLKKQYITSPAPPFGLYLARVIY